MKYNFDECAHHYRVMQEDKQNMERENLALKEQVKKLTRPESDVIYDLREEFKKADEKKDQSIKAAERRYETCKAEKDQLKADATHNANTDSEWKKTALAKERELVESEKQLVDSRARSAELQATVKEAEKQINNLQKDLQDTNDKGRLLEETHNETVIQRDELQKKHDDILVKARGLESNYNSLKQDVIRQTNEYDELNSENNELRSKNDELHAEIYDLNQLQENYDVLSEEVEGMEAKYHDQAKELADAKSLLDQSSKLTQLSHGPVLSKTYGN